MNKKILFLILLGTILILPLAASASVACGSTSGGNSALNTIMTNISDAASTVGSALAVVGFIIAAIMWLTAAGSPEKTGAAKKALIAAVVGCAILALAQGANIMTGIFCDIIGSSSTGST